MKITDTHIEAGFSPYWQVISSKELNRAPTKKVDVSKLLPGDVLLYMPDTPKVHQRLISKMQWAKKRMKKSRCDHSMWTHVGLYLGEGKVLDAVGSVPAGGRQQVDEISIEKFTEGGYIRAIRYYKVDYTWSLQDLDLSMAERSALVASARNQFMGKKFRYSAKDAIKAGWRQKTASTAYFWKRVRSLDFFDFDSMFSFDLPYCSPSDRAKSKWYCANLVHEVFNSNGYILFSDALSIVPADFSASMNFYSVDLNVC